MGGRSKSSNSTATTTTAVDGTAAAQGDNNGVQLSGVNGNVNLTTTDQGAVKASLDFAGKVATGLQSSTEKAIKAVSDATSKVSTTAISANKDIAGKSIAAQNELSKATIQSNNDLTENVLRNNSDVLKTSFDNNQDIYKAALSSVNSAASQAAINAKDSRKWAGELADKAMQSKDEKSDDKVVWISGALIITVGVVLTAMALKGKK
ncbi:hypothetical protein [Photobacterium damselae]|uniref:Methyl-accepting chemotaxis protein n=1 Tax=Photobacterium damselae TaxID=38293 RepID=A0ABD6WZA0_PHODM|nr:hypothetical protein [Photobacterium damselae]KAB1510147.1 hypothetical protein FD717_011620 [Photobacterium damselae subsp. damselae]MCG9779489.1 hypothetical protein [Photobacterium damselae]OBU38819.1 hypothetical protein AYY27_11680 [Photobacterium damselae]ODA24579.1 hypothetical protein A0J46_16195 [Photobacterium damselae subsp. damselae]PSU15081.1 hypothetical protein CTM90_18270 [Photobacterium damselae]